MKVIVIVIYCVELKKQIIIHKSVKGRGARIKFYWCHNHYHIKMYSGLKWCQIREISLLKLLMVPLGKNVLGQFP